MFRFKQFTIIQDKAAMKVGTDGVLLGAWSDLKNAKNILDIGSGTGLLSLMSAQRSHAKITAIDIDEKAYFQTKENVENSIWKERILVKKVSFQEFLQENTEKFDFIICNPPFFSNSLKNTNKQKSLARHNDNLPFEDLIKGVSEILQEKGTFSIVLPSLEEENIKNIASNNNLFVKRILYLKPTPQKLPKRIFVEFSKKRIENIEDITITAEISRHNYTQEYKNLTSDFYLYY